MKRFGNRELANLGGQYDNAPGSLRVPESQGAFDCKMQ
jgi:hypothetical protein